MGGEPCLNMPDHSRQTVQNRRRSIIDRTTTPGGIPHRSSANQPRPTTCSRAAGTIPRLPHARSHCPSTRMPLIILPWKGRWLAAGQTEGCPPLAKGNTHQPSAPLPPASDQKEGIRKRKPLGAPTAQHGKRTRPRSSRFPIRISSALPWRMRNVRPPAPAVQGREVWK